MSDILALGFRLLLETLTGLMIVINVSSALKTAKNSEYLKFGVDVAFIVYWILIMAKLVLHF